MSGLSFPAPISVNPTRYGIRKARAHAQAEANRLNRRVFLQLDSQRCYGTYALVSCDRPFLMGAPWFTYYPISTDEKGQ